MHLLEKTLPTLAENLALDEALLLHAEAGGRETLRLWEWPRHAVVVGAAGRLADEIDEFACRADEVPIGRRSSGGGTVLLGPGCLLFSLILRFERHPALADLHASYRYILDNIGRGLQNCFSPPPVGHAASVPNRGGTLAACPTGGEGVMLRGTSDLAIGDRKCAGNAQQRKRTHLLHHGTLLYAFDSTPIARYLKMPPRQPEYRQGRTHADFLVNLPLTAESLKRAMTEIWQANATLTDWPAEMTAELTREKYLTEEWIRRR